MNPNVLRGARLSALALSLGALAACADDPAAPRPDAPRLAYGDVYTVTNASGGGEVGSLRWVLGLATGGEIIRFAPALAGDTIVLDTTLVIDVPITIEGDAAEGITLSGGGKWRVLRHATSGLSTLRNVSIMHGFAGDAPAIIGIGHVVIQNGTVSHNQATRLPAIVLDDLTLINSTVSSNVSAEGQPALVARGVTLVNSTVANNTSRGIAADTLTLQNSLLALNSGPNCQLAGAVVVKHEARNISDDNNCGGAGDALTIVEDAQIDTLADNGGPGLTHALRPASPAVDAGTSCAFAIDQRHVERDAACDLGAYELVVPISVTLTIDPTVLVSQPSGAAVATGTVQCSATTTFGVAATLRQEQKSGRTTAIVQASGSTPVACDTTPRPWSVALAPTSGGFVAGDATLTAATQGTPTRVTPASATSAVKLYAGRR